MDTQDSFGYIVAVVCTGGNSIPVEGATVTISSINGAASTVLAVKQTNSSGLTEAVQVSAPALEYSLSPGSSEVPFSNYTVSVVKNGYYNIEAVFVKVFSGTTSVQPFNMIPYSGGQLIGGKPLPDVFINEDIPNNL